MPLYPSTSRLISSAVTGLRSAIRYEISDNWRISFSVSLAIRVGVWRGGGLRWSGRGWDAPHASAGMLVARRASRVAEHAAERPPRPTRYPHADPYHRQR